VTPDSVRRLLDPVLTWLSEVGDAWQMDLEYWRVRQDLIDEGETFAGPPARLLSRLDTAMDVFNPDPSRDPDQIDEDQLRSEARAVVADLRQSGFLESPHYQEGDSA
jgi:hypothetical protein